MDKYYYLIAQLPMLFFDRAPLFGMEAFLEEAEKWMGSRDYHNLRSIDYADISRPSEGPRIWRTVKAFEIGLRRDLAEMRRSRREGTEYRPDRIPASAREGNPLEVEKKLLRLRWDFLSEVEKEHHFDFDAVALYFMKMQVLSRLLVFDKERGRERYRGLIEGTVRSGEGDAAGAAGTAEKSGAAEESGGTENEGGTGRPETGSTEVV